MRMLCFLALASFMVVAKSDNVLRVAGQLALNNRHGLSPLLRRAELMHRVRRQARVILGPREPEQCVLDCVETMDEKLVAAFPEEANITDSSKDEMTAALLEGDYDPAKFEKFCDIYTPSGRCLHQCPKSDLKSFTEKSLAMVEFMCVDRYNDFRKYGTCMDKAGKEIDVICTPQCSVYEKGLEKLENLTRDDNVSDYDDFDVNELLNETCSYVSCLTQCDYPHMVERCGKSAADLEKETIRIAFASLDDLLASATDSAFWPESCAKLGNKNGKTKPSSMDSSVKGSTGHLSKEMAQDGDD